MATDVALPRCTCERHLLGPLYADAQAAPWPACAALQLRENLASGAPQQATTIRVARDSGELRVLFEVADTCIAASLTERDAPLYSEEVVEVFLDPVGDLESYFELEVNPLNAVLDLVLRKTRSGYRKDVRWQCAGLRTLTRRDSAGWTAELSIPFASIAAEAPAAGAIWRANFLRIDRPPNRPRELSAWSPTGYATFHVPERFGFLEFAG